MSRLAIGLVILVFMIGACSEGGPTKSPTRTQPPTFQLEWGVEGTGEGQFHEPEGIAVDAEGNVYVADSSNLRIQKFTSDGVFLAEWGLFYGVEGLF